MAEALNPDGAPKPASRYVQAVRHGAGAERLVISGQIGVDREGRIAEGLAAQMEQAWRNLVAVIEGAGFRRSDLVKVVIYMTAPGDVALYRTVRDRMLEGHLAATTLVIVAGLASPALLFEVEGEAVREDRM